MMNLITYQSINQLLSTNINDNKRIYISKLLDTIYNIPDLK